MARLALIITLVITIVSCGNQYFDRNILNAQLISINQEIDQINEKLNQVKAAEEIAVGKENKLMRSMKGAELSIYDRLKTARLKQDMLQYTQLLGEYKNYLKAAYPYAKAADRLEETISVLTDINNNYTKKYNLTVQLQSRTVELERLKRDIAVNTPR